MDHLATMGEDMDVVGATAPRGAMARRIAARPGWLKLATEQGVSTPSEELDVLPFSVSSVLNSTTNTCDATAFPQRPFRGERLIISAVLYDAATSTFSDAGNLVAIDPAIYVGAVQVGASQGAIPVAAFAATAFGVRLSLPTAGQGTRIFVPFRLATGVVLSADQTVTVQVTLVGRAVR